MAKRIFISFAVEDATLRDFLVGQARNDKSPFEFVDMSVKQPWDNEWKTKCRTKIKGCDGMIAIVSKNSKSANGQIWEVKCAKEEAVPTRGIYADSDNKPSFLPEEFNAMRIVEWKWDNIKNFINSL
jgi:hypothetical protein